MRIGICIDYKEIGKAQAMGFDYIECITNSVATLSKKEFAEVTKLVDSNCVQCEAFNGFFPWSMKLIGPESDDKITREYIKIALERAAILGAKIVVVGNGGARRVPEGWDIEKGIEKFAQVLVLIGEEASQYGIVAVVEPLNKEETNVVNYITEGIELVNTINHKNVKLLADFYHMRRNNEKIKTIVKAGNLLRHVHIANGINRAFPLSRTEDEYVDFFKALNEISYNGRMSIEGNTEKFEKDGPASLSLLRKLSISL